MLLTRDDLGANILQPIASDTAVKLQQLIAEYNQKANLRMELVLDDGNAFNGLCKINLSIFYSKGVYVIMILKKMIKSSVDDVCHLAEIRAEYKSRLLR